MAKEINLSSLWNPAFNSVWNAISSFVVGKEGRGDRPPCKYDELFLQGGRACVDGDTLISTPSGEIKIKDFKGGDIYSVDIFGNIVITVASKPIVIGREALYKVTLFTGEEITCTARHRFLTYDGWKKCEELNIVRDEIITKRTLLPFQKEWGAYRDDLSRFADRDISDAQYSDDIGLMGRRIHDMHMYESTANIKRIEYLKTDFFYDMFVPFYNNYIGNGMVHHNSGKSYFASVIVWLALENDPKKNAVIFRKVGSSLRKSCWKQMTKVWKRLQLDHWRPNKTDMTFTNKLTGQQIYFLGLDDEEKARSITVDNGYLSIAWFEEAKQFKDMEEIDQAVSSILRGGDEDDDDDGVKGDDIDDDGELDLGDMEYMTILTYNPPKSHFDWINKEAKSGVSKKSRLTHKSTYLTMPPRWLGRKVLSEINSMKERKPAQYEHMYLGKITGTGGEYFKNITIRKITDEEIANFDYFNMGIDWGYHDPNVWLKTYIRDGRMYIFDEIYQNEIPPDGKKYVEFAKKVKKKTRNCPDDTIYCDAQDKGGMAVFKLDEFDIPIAEAPKQGANGRLAGYSYFQGLDEIIIDPDRCPHSAVEFPMFEAKLAPGGKGWLDEPGTKGDHCPDAARYSEWENIRNNSRNEDYDPVVDSDNDSDDEEEFEIADMDDYFDDIDDE